VADYGKPFTSLPGGVPRPGSVYGAERAKRKIIPTGGGLVPTLSYPSDSKTTVSYSTNGRTILTGYPSEHRFTVNGDDFVVTRDLRVTCQQCMPDSFWCNHLQAALKVNADAEDIWENYPNPYRFELPMVPTHNLYLVILLDKVDFGENIYQVYFFSEKTQNDEFVGYIHPGEGRFILRSMIFNWFRGNVKFDKLLCQNSAHSYKAEKIWQTHMKDSGKKIIEAWSAWTTDRCLHCNAGKEAGTDLDLVPEQDESKFHNKKYTRKYPR